MGVIGMLSAFYGIYSFFYLVDYGVPTAKSIGMSWVLAWGADDLLTELVKLLTGTG